MNLWPREKAGIVVRANALGAMLMVDYTQWVDGVISLQETRTTGGYVDSTFTCSWAELPKNGAGVIYQGGITNQRGLGYRETQKQPLKLKIELGNKCKQTNKGKTLECNLKVTTEGTDLKISN
ncbi:hypothetical protein DNK47_03280 [Mycoplasma wenyonii]|uniref:Uncharacterized protein n=1 Tax=Mycoplasma wenyonii TaxID=65123 RepID=A0A328PI73_9MOLU|nr:hypothetical protein [Mycoplasma wenyonii]RAO94763.1 hypothetical protein DNK47_03280 [Mycoplasma wenyonii]